MTGRWNQIKIRTRLPCRTLLWYVTNPLLNLHHRRPVGNKALRNRKWLFSDRSSAPGATPSSRSLLPAEYRGLREPARTDGCAPPWKVKEAIQSIPQTTMLKTTVPAKMARNRTIHMPNRSCGLIPIVHANDDMPFEAPSGRVKMRLGASASI